LTVIALIVPTTSTDRARNGNASLRGGAMTDIDEYGRELFKGRCPYTDKKCESWKCEDCEVEKAEIDFADNKNEEV